MQLFLPDVMCRLIDKAEFVGQSSNGKLKMESVGSALHFSSTLYRMFSEEKPPSFSTFNFKFSITVILINRFTNCSEK